MFATVVRAEITNCVAANGNPPAWIVYSTQSSCPIEDSKITYETKVKLDQNYMDWVGLKQSIEERDKKRDAIIMKDPIAGKFFMHYDEKIKEKVRNIKLGKEDKKIPEIVDLYYQGEDINPMIVKFEKESVDKINLLIQNKKINLFHKKCTDGWFSAKAGTVKYQECLNQNEKQMITESKRQIDTVIALRNLPKEQRISETCMKVFDFKKGSSDYNTCVLNSLMVDMNNERSNNQQRIKALELEIQKLKMTNSENQNSNTIIVNSGAEELAKELKRQRRMDASDDLDRISKDLLGGKSIGESIGGVSPRPRSGDVCFFDSESRSGLNKICYYRCTSGMKTKNVGVSQTCPVNY
jgi:hypothetical protein